MAALAGGCSGRTRSPTHWTARKEADRSQCPVLVEAMIDRLADASMGTSIDAIVEFEEVG